jgi:putative flippase GtrA
MEKLNRKRWIKFCIVGAIGMIPNYILFTIFKETEITIFFQINIGWIFGIFAGMTSNYILNEVWTWK